MKQRATTLTATTKLAANPKMTSVVERIILHSMFLNFLSVQWFLKKAGVFNQ
jgi:hypothetical protein